MEAGLSLRSEPPAVSAQSAMVDRKTSIPGSSTLSSSSFPSHSSFASVSSSSSYSSSDAMVSASDAPAIAAGAAYHLLLDLTILDEIKGRKAKQIQDLGTSFSVPFIWCLAHLHFSLLCSHEAVDGPIIVSGVTQAHSGGVY